MNISAVYLISCARLQFSVMEMNASLIATSLVYPTYAVIIHHYIRFIMMSHTPKIRTVTKNITTFEVKIDHHSMLRESIVLTRLARFHQNEIFNDLYNFFLMTPSVSTPRYNLDDSDYGVLISKVYKSQKVYE